MQLMQMMARLNNPILNIPEIKSPDIHVNQKALLLIFSNYCPHNRKIVTTSASSLAALLHSG